MRARIEPVVAHRVRVEHMGGDALLSCSLRSRGGELPPELWFRFPSATASFIEAVGDPFLPPLLLYCMKEGVPLAIEAEVSAMLLAAVRPIQDLYGAWSANAGDRLRPLDVTAAATVRPRQAASSAAFFSCGVDSFYTLLRNAARYPRDDSRFIEHLVLVHGFDIAIDDRVLFEQVVHHGRRAADHFGRRLVTVATNVRAATGSLDWGRYGHGAALAAVALALGRMAHTVFIPSTAAFVELKPWGSHPALDPLWSTEQVELVYDGGEATRDRKIGLIASSAAALASLRVCWENREGAYNCGQCEKCLRTMIELQLCRALDRAEQFPRSIDASDLARLTIPENCRKYWRRILGCRAELAQDVVDAIESALSRSGGARAKSWW